MTKLIVPIKIFYRQNIIVDAFQTDDAKWLYLHKNYFLAFQIDLSELGDYAEHFDAKTLLTEPVKVLYKLLTMKQSFN